MLCLQRDAMICRPRRPFHGELPIPRSRTARLTAWRRSLWAALQTPSGEISRSVLILTGSWDFFSPPLPNRVTGLFARVAVVVLDDLPTLLLRQELLHVEDAVGGGNDLHGPWHTSYAVWRQKPTAAQFGCHIDAATAGATRGAEG